MKAARALGGYTAPAKLAMHPLLVENGIKDSRLRELESMKGRADVRPMELEIIARACGLPAEFFTAPFERLASHVSLEEQMASLEQAVRRVLEPQSADRLRQEAARQASEDESAAGRPASGGRRRPA